MFVHARDDKAVWHSAQLENNHFLAALADAVPERVGEEVTDPLAEMGQLRAALDAQDEMLRGLLRHNRGLMVKAVRLHGFVSYFLLHSVSELVKQTHFLS